MIGDSIAINGCCLTVAELAAKGRAKVVQFDLLKETWNLTNLQYCRAGSLVNLERSLEAGGRLGGHFVTGHIDGMGKITAWEKVGDDRQLQIAAPDEVMCTDSTSINLYKVLGAALAKRPGRHRIVAERDNFPTDLYIADQAAQRAGPAHHVQWLAPGQTIEAALDEDVAVLMLTHVDYRTGAMPDSEGTDQSEQWVADNTQVMRDAQLYATPVIFYQDDAGEVRKVMGAPSPDKLRTIMGSDSP